MRNAIVCSTALFFILELTITAFGLFLGTGYAPIKRLIWNAESYLEENPNSAEAHYTLGRIHYMAFATRIPYAEGQVTDSFPNLVSERHMDTDTAVYLPGLTSSFASDLALSIMGFEDYVAIPDSETNYYRYLENEISTRLIGENWAPKRLSDSELVVHASSAWTNLARAIRLAPSQAIYYLTLASFEYQYVAFRESNVGRIKEDSIVSKITLYSAKEHFYKAFELATVEESTYDCFYDNYEGVVSYEAGQAFLALASENSPFRDQNSNRIDAVKSAIAKIESVECSWVTPVILSFERQESVADLIWDARSASFDLDGNGIIESWNWVKPTTGFLVWDPDRTGMITSGRQLFGNATWWMFYPNGYRALDALDDDRNGYLERKELIGIRVWFDRDSDGVSDAGEVVSLASLNIIALGVRHTGAEGMHLVHDRGAILKNGIVIKTYDWVTSPVVE